MKGLKLSCYMHFLYYNTTRASDTITLGKIWQNMIYFRHTLSTYRLVFTYSRVRINPKLCNKLKVNNS